MRIDKPRTGGQKLSTQYVPLGTHKLRLRSLQLEEREFVMPSKVNVVHQNSSKFHDFSEWNHPPHSIGDPQDRILRLLLWEA